MLSLSSDVLLINIKVPYYVVIINFSVECSETMITFISLIHIVLMMRLLSYHWDLVKSLGESDDFLMRVISGEHYHNMKRF